MKNIQLLSSCLVSALALCGMAGCADGSRNDRDERDEPEARVTAGLQRVLDDAVSSSDALLPGTITYYREPDHTAWSGSAGMGDMKAAARMRVADGVRGGSIVKTFLATVTLQHVEEGTLSLDQTLPELLPRSVTERVKNADRITLRMLLGHTSGIPEWDTPDIDVQVVRDPTHVYSDDEVLDLVAKQPAWFDPGTSWRYSNSDYTLVGMLLDRLGEGTWREQVHERVIAPLGLRHTHLPEPGDLSIPGDYAHGYQDIGDGAVVDLTRVDSSMAGAAGGHALLTTVADLGRFLDALLDGKLFTQRETLQAMTTMIDAPDESGFPHRYGLGLESFELNGTKVIGHAGGAPGYTVMMYRIPERDATLVTAVNTGDLFTNALQVFMPSLEVVTAPDEKM